MIKCLFILFSLRTNRQLFSKVNRTLGKFSTDKIKKEKKHCKSVLTSEKKWAQRSEGNSMFLIPMKECLLVMFGLSTWRIRIQHFSHKHDGIVSCPLCLYLILSASQCQGINQSAGDIITWLHLYDRILSVHVAELLLWNITNISSGQA